MTHDAAGCALLACELCDAYGSGWAAGVMGGTASYRNPDLARWLAGLGPVQVWSDGDRAGVEASGVLAKRVVSLGGRASIERVGVGEDPGAAAAPFAPLDVATVEDYAADLERDGLPSWEALRLAATCTRWGGGEPHMNRVKTQCWVIPKRPVHLLLGYMGAGHGAVCAFGRGGGSHTPGVHSPSKDAGHLGLGRVGYGRHWFTA